MKRLKSLLLALTLSLSLSIPAFATEQTFTDVPSTHWAYEDIERAAADGAVNGVGNDQFNPDGTLTLAEWTAIVTRVFWPNKVNTSTATGEWYAKNEAVAKELGLLDGISNTDMDSPINRYDMALIMTHVLDKACGILPNEYGIEYAKTQIGDMPSIPEQYQDAVAIVFKMRVIKGVDDSNTFNGEGYFTRAQAATVYVRTVNTVEGITGKKLADINAETNAEKLAADWKLTNGKPVTEENVLELIEELKVKYPDNSHFDPDTFYPANTLREYGNTGRKIRGRACTKLALMLSDEIFGYLPVRMHTDITKLRPGDIICTKIHWTMASTSLSSSPIINPAATPLPYYVCEVATGGEEGIVNWKECYVFLDDCDFYTIYTRYPD